MNASSIRIGSRKSPLARAQTEAFAATLDVCPSLVWIRSEGDADRTTELSGFGGAGVFTAALHRGALRDRIDVAVHSLKDLPAAAPAGLRLGVRSPSADPRDVLLTTGRRAVPTTCPGAPASGRGARGGPPAGSGPSGRTSRW